MTKKSIYVLALMALVACKSKPEAPLEEKATFVLSDQTLASIQLDSAVQAPLRNELNFYGQITADNNKMIEIFPVVGGNVLRVYVELGDYVKKGQILATIRSTEVAGFEKELKDAENDLLVAENNLKVAEELFAGKISTEREVLEARNQVEKARTQLRRMEETYHIYSMKPGSIYEVRSPLDGFVVQKNINEDMVLRSDRTDNIFDIAEIDEVWAIANVNEADINLVRLGVDAFVSALSYPDRIFEGKVDKIFNILDPETKAMKIRIRLPNREFLLKPLMRANIRLAYTEDKKMIRVPSSAIIFARSKNFVMVYKDRNNIETREVNVFRQVGQDTFIDEGLEAGEIVITKNQLFIYDALNE